LVVFRAFGGKLAAHNCSAADFLLSLITDFYARLGSMAVQRLAQEVSPALEQQQF
jgi:hypothetical protein